MTPLAGHRFNSQNEQATHSVKPNTPNDCWGVSRHNTVIKANKRLTHPQCTLLTVFKKDSASIKKYIAADKTDYVGLVHIFPTLESHVPNV